MIVDSHAHIFSPEVVAGPETYRERDDWFALLNPGARPRLAAADDLTAEMARSGVDVSVAVGFGWRDQALCVEQNDALIAAGRNSGGQDRTVLHRAAPGGRGGRPRGRTLRGGGVPGGRRAIPGRAGVCR